uniref:PsbP C-terminal domain-containing protein n=1 Tax=Chromera velia CCMP2878 TaxID=1169474 RepID=A0A0G4G410_9ALVE|mmetsp:Transcript_56182/g.110018  ORF Transcript_56182/g.110018 Transcript_56182/m.110018 type:complete len:361 (-) Transcript_56182:91-1173(-)|eukprot:Cvel_20184.t1-p1 / transcript=Cvel_20184.t1 / gene=Cvel_20184 / organism=Chromera_velia_CCMP2878 / gene_product=hypothetical protein / transcript_product=hypothetical protein / location=Cvel_scaffold1794:23629-27460(+) / protein_length=360 / sequence_SO=supercontig / SO=protein_coding / is_pseudo=false
MRGLRLPSSLFVLLSFLSDCVPLKAPVSSILAIRRGERCGRVPLFGYGVSAKCLNDSSRTHVSGRRRRAPCSAVSVSSVPEPLEEEVLPSPQVHGHNTLDSFVSDLSSRSPDRHAPPSPASFEYLPIEEWRRGREPSRHQSLSRLSVAAAFLPLFRISAGSRDSAEAASPPLVALETETGEATGLKKFQTEDKSITIGVPQDFKLSNKLVQTHIAEYLFVSPTTKKFQAGIVVDPLQVNSLKLIGSAEDVAKSVVRVEAEKDGAIAQSLKRAESFFKNNELYYLIEYESETSRYHNRFIVVLNIRKKSLYALTVQCKEEDYSSVKDQMEEIAKSFEVFVPRTKPNPDLEPLTETTQKSAA